MKREEIAELMQKGIDFAERKENQQAAEVFEELLKGAGEDFQVLYNAGIFFSQAGEHLRAVELLEKSQSKSPNAETLRRLILEHLHIGGAHLFTTDFMAWDVAHLLKAEEKVEELLRDYPQDTEAPGLKERIQQRKLKERVALRFMEDDMEFARKTLARKKELTDLDQRVQGFLNLLDSGEYLKKPQEFAVVMRSDLPTSPKEGFLERIRNYVLGK